MVNINHALPPAIAASFHAPTETLQHDNLQILAIPKTEVISAYAKNNRQTERETLFEQSQDFLQEKTEQEEQHQQRRTALQRSHFFAQQGIVDKESDSKELVVVRDFKLAMSVIQAKYHNAVTPRPEPSIDFQL